MKSAMTAALDILSRRMVTRFELQKQLERKGYEADEISDVFRKLGEWGYIDDYSYAVKFCESRMNSYSRLKTAQSLHLRGINKEIIEGALQKVYSEEDELNNCILIAERLWEKVKKSEQRREKFNTEQLKDTIYQKVARKLIQKGYPFETVKKALREVCN